MKENNELYAYVTPELKRGMIMNTEIKVGAPCAGAADTTIN